MTLRHLGIIGAGSISSELVTVLHQTLPRPLARITVLVRPGRIGSADGMALMAAKDFAVVDSLKDFRDAAPDLVLECAGHAAVKSYVPDLLRAGIETVVVSTGALADPDLHGALTEAASAGKTRLILPAGAVGAMDILSSISHGDVQSVTYVSRKPPRAWAGTQAEDLLDLDGLQDEAVFFEGPAREAALEYPKNANVAATIALAGVGFERTMVRMIADPAVSANIHSFEVVSQAAEMSVRIKGKPSPRNPKTSLPTVYSLVREVMRRVSPVVT